MQDYLEYWNKLLWPLLRLLLGMSCGLLLASALEALGWSRWLGRVALPLTKLARIGPLCASAFSLAFVSPSASSATLAEGFQKGAISRRELSLANLFNTLPAWLSHAPMIFFLMWPALGFGALIYAGLTFLAACLRALFVALLGHFLMPPCAKPLPDPGLVIPENRWRHACNQTLKRFRRRLPRLLIFTIPFYILMWISQRLGFFGAFNAWLAENLSWLSFLNPQAMGIIVLQLTAEMGSALGAAAAALEDTAITVKDVVLALLTGNILATPLRALRHQLPAFAGFFPPGLAIRLVAANQCLRAASILCILIAYAFI